MDSINFNSDKQDNINPNVGYNLVAIEIGDRDYALQVIKEFNETNLNKRGKKHNMIIEPGTTYYEGHKKLSNKDLALQAVKEDWENLFYVDISLQDNPTCG